MDARRSSNPAIIFDFDGTIADSLMATLRVVYELVHHQPLPKENLSELRGMGARATLRALHIPLWRALLLVGKARQMLGRHIDDIVLISGIDAAIKQLGQQHELYILSSNDVPSIRKFLQRYQLESYFVDIIGDATLWHKSGALRKCMKKHQLRRQKTWYVGDRSWDVGAAHSVGIKAAAVAWGYSNIHVLKRSRPDILVFTADELVAALDKAQ